MKIKLVSYLVVFFTIVSCNADKMSLEPDNSKAISVLHQVASCTEHVFEAVIGVDEAVSGYSGEM
jgi:peptide-methionine (S)-S-oxide reductase